MRNMIPEMRAMFPNVESLVRLLLVNLRRLETYLRSSCAQRCLNNLVICVDVQKLMKEFVLAQEHVQLFLDIFYSPH
jgi:hypothetical protein